MHAFECNIFYLMFISWTQFLPLDIAENASLLFVTSLMWFSTLRDLLSSINMNELNLRR